MIISLKCFSCSKELSFTDRVSLREECPSCRADVHACRNCSFYDPKAYNECREPQAERVQDRDHANRCDYFSPGNNSGTGVSKADQLREAAEALFKKK
ncbi:MAG: hypothetical protein AABY64_09505 [Bdellovibrionota bacterium]